MIQLPRMPRWHHGPRRCVLRVGYVEARPWSYRAQQGVMGLDTIAVSLVAEKMACSIEYACRPPSQLAAGLLNREYDLAVGGLLDSPHSSIVAVAVPHARILASIDEVRSRCRRAFFPNVWWVRRYDLPLRYNIARTLLRYRLGIATDRVAGGYEAQRSGLSE